MLAVLAHRRHVTTSCRRHEEQEEAAITSHRDAALKHQREGMVLTWLGLLGVFVGRLFGLRLSLVYLAVGKDSLLVYAAGEVLNCVFFQSFTVVFLLAVQMEK